MLCALNVSRGRFFAKRPPFSKQLNTSPTELMELKLKEAEVYFKKSHNYEKAILAFSEAFMLGLGKNTARRFEAQMALARSYFYLQRFFQAAIEANQALAWAVGDSQNFASHKLRSDIYLAKGSYEEARKAYQKLLSQYPKQAVQEKLYLSLVQCYEKSGKHALAINFLEQFLKLGSLEDTEFIKLKLKRLRVAQKNAPRVKGLY